MSIAAPVLETPDPNSIDTLPITIEEVVVALVQQVDRAQSAADAAGVSAEEAASEAALAEARRVAALASQTAAAASAAAAAAQGAASIAAINAAEAASIDDIEAARDQAIIDVMTAGSIPAFASNAEALAGTADNRIMSPLRVQEKINASASAFETGVATMMKYGAI